jgi:hypothetical protein
VTRAARNRGGDTELAQHGLGEEASDRWASGERRVADWWAATSLWETGKWLIGSG